MGDLPGSGKTIDLRKVLELEVVGLNFYSSTTPELIFESFEQCCECPITSDVIWKMSCRTLGRDQPSRGRQRVFPFIRQLVDPGGHWRTSDMAWPKATEWLSLPSSLWVPSYSVSAQGIPAVSAHNSPVVVTVDIPANNVLVSETNDPPIPEAGKDIEVDPSSNSELNFHIQPEESKDRPRPSSPWVPSYSVTRSSSVLVHASPAIAHAVLAESETPESIVHEALTVIRVKGGT
ncbi:hypothetical protein F5878DRAFT_664989 [Lentinula raphanica]|uniref:Uncharacterized protein n=1 Tax=Lentinula raphanica TaxID=153919 RepID=A0AA38P0T5_9AGAR|nr:hypothetical protein F5878DRAFT_664989 [Lentinula raphanica]